MEHNMLVSQYRTQEAAAIPTFLLKLVNLLNDESNHDFVNWNETGTSFIIKDQVQFSSEILPKYFKHNKFASFVRQLNMYGFRKITSLTQSGLRNEKEEVEFYHHMFIQGQEYLLENIKRKVTKTDDSSRQPEDVVKVLTEVKQMQTQQKDMNEKLMDLRQENVDLWREIVSLRQKHSHQQRVVNKLIQFLVNLVQQHRMGGKRKLPLMIEDGSSGATNYPPATKYSRSLLYEADDKSDADLEQVTTSTVSYPASVKPVNQEVNSIPGPSIEEEFSPALSDANAAESTVVTGQHPLQEIPSMGNLASPPDLGFDMSEYVNSQPLEGNQGGESLSTNQLNMALHELISHDTSEEPVDATGENSGKEKRNKLMKYISPSSSFSIDPSDLNSHVDMVQNNLIDIQERLRNKDQVQLDYSLIQELFSTSPDIMPLTEPDFANEGGERSIEGNELVLHADEIGKRNQTFAEDLIKLSE